MPKLSTAIIGEMPPLHAILAPLSSQLTLVSPMKSPWSLPVGKCCCLAVPAVVALASPSLAAPKSGPSSLNMVSTRSWAYLHPPGSGGQPAGQHKGDGTGPLTGPSGTPHGDPALVRPRPACTMCC
jgi:hypothetical protein